MPSVLPARVDVQAGSSQYSFGGLRFQQRFQLATCPEQPRAHGIDGDREQFGDLVVRQLFIFTKHENLAMIRIQSGDGLTNPDSSSRVIAGWEFGGFVEWPR